MNAVRVKILREGAKLPTYGSALAAGADLYACLDADVTVEPGKTQFIPTGLAMEIEAMEQRNRKNFEIAMSRERKEIKMRRKSKESASKYYQNFMKATSSESFYMDKKK